MQENRNVQSCLGNDARGMICIDTTRVLDACRDRDCFENVRVYLTATGEEILAASSNIRTKSAKICWAYVGVNEVPFNSGFYQITVRYYIELGFEACVGIGRSQTFNGVAVVEKDVVLYGGEGNITSYTSDSGAGYCDVAPTSAISNNLPVATVETVEPIVLGTKVVECGCQCCCDCYDIPEPVRCCLDGELVSGSDYPQLQVSIGVFSVIRLTRPAQLLVQATDYSVPDKECMQATNNDNPCDLFRNIAFPAARFTGTTLPTRDNPGKSGGCGCGK